MPSFRILGLPSGSLGVSNIVTDWSFALRRGNIAYNVRHQVHQMLDGPESKQYLYSICTVSALLPTQHCTVCIPELKAFQQLSKGQSCRNSMFEGSFHPYQVTVTGTLFSLVREGVDAALSLCRRS